MLILTRRVGEAVEIKDTRTGVVLGTISIMGIAAGQVRVGFDLPRHIQVLRDNAIDRNSNTTGTRSHDGNEENSNGNRSEATSNERGD